MSFNFWYPERDIRKIEASAFSESLCCSRMAVSNASACRFLTFIGHVDSTSTGDQTPLKLLQYHLGRNQLYSKVKLTGDYDIEPSLN